MFLSGQNWIYEKPLSLRPFRQYVTHPQMAAFSRIVMPCKHGTAMRGALVLMAMLVVLPAHAAAPILSDKPIARIDGLIATAKGNNILIQARGAVMGGGWKRVALKPVKPNLPGDAHTIVVEFVAQPPASNQAVIPGLLPVTAIITVKNRKGIVSVRAMSAINEITTQILK
jgi:hypothetical protein